MKYEEEIATYLHQKKVISQEDYDLLVNKISTKKFSLNWELRTLLYIGITLFTSGLSIIIYKNISEMGHIALIILLFGTCFFTYGYTIKNALPFSKIQVNNPSPFYDYAVLLASLLLISAIGYLQFKYAFLGNFASYSALIISLILFATAFKFDHKGVLTLAITFHASFFGLVVTPMNFFENFSDYNSQIILQTALGVGLLFYIYTFIIKYTAIKVHFSIIFLQFAFNIFLLAALIGVFTQYNSLVYYLILLVGGFVSFVEAKRHQSFAIYLSMVLVNFIALSYYVLNFLIEISASAAIYIGFMYLAFGGFVLVYLLKNHKKFLGYDQV